MNVTLLNADFEQRVVLPSPGPGDSSASPMAGVRLRMLDRVGGEVARATSLVRYAPASRFERHEHGEYPAGSWLRNVRWSMHAPFRASAD